MELEDFFTIYPEPKSNGLFNLKDISVINSLKEFSENILEEDDSTKLIDGIVIGTKYQTTVSRLLSGYTKFDSLLICHEMGTGKTCTAIHTIELHLKQHNYGIKKALILTKGASLMDNFKNELITKCTYNIYSKNNKEGKRNIKDVYSFSTFETFASFIKQSSDDTIRSRYNNHIIVIDEVHNIRLHDRIKNKAYINVYNEMHRFLHLITNKKILLLTGTPMKDSVEEIAPIMNLILPLDKQLPTEQLFLEKYFTAPAPPPATAHASRGPGPSEARATASGARASELRPVSRMINIPDFKKYLYGYVSFLKAKITDIAITEVGESIGRLQFLKVIRKQMSEFQTSFYLNAYRQDRIDKSIYNNSRQASLFVFPNGSYGSTGFETYINKLGETKWRLKKSFTKYLMFEDKKITILEKLLLLKQYSVKYSTIIEALLKSSEEGKNSFVFCEQVSGSGLILLSLLLEEFGYAPHNSNSNCFKYALLTNHTKHINNIINIFNKPNNKTGNNISVILGSKIVAEGFTLKNIYNVHIITPHWNYSETSQIISRVLRINSHDTAPTELRNGPASRAPRKDSEAVRLPSVHIFKYVAVPKSKKAEDKSIDLKMYEVSEQKDIKISKVIRCLREAAIDCFLFKKQNTFSSTKDGTRECEYQNCDYYCDVEADTIGTIGSARTIGPGEAGAVNYQNIYAKLYYKEINDYFSKRFILNDPEDKLLPTLYHIIYNNILIKNKYGYMSYLNFKGNSFYLTDTVYVYSDPDFSLYTKFPNLEAKFSNAFENFKDITASIAIKNVLCSKGNLDIINTLPLDTQQTILEYTLLLTTAHPSRSREGKLSQILEKFKNNYKYLNNNNIILYGLDKDKCLENNKWRLCKADEESILKKIKTYTVDNKYLIYGLKNSKINEFCIRHNKPKDLHDKRKVQPGKRCLNWRIDHLISAILKLPFDYDKVKLPSLKDSDRKVNLDNYLLEVYRSFSKDGERSLSEKDLNVLKRKIWFWGKFNKRTICDMLQSWFDSKGILFEDAFCGVQKKKK